MSSNPNPHPAHQELLNLVPGELHPLIIPVLKKWDQGVNDQFQKIRDEYKEYEAFKPLIENNVDPNFAQQAVQLASQLQDNPAAILEQVNQHFDLGYLSPDQAKELQSNSQTDLLEDTEFTMNDDLLKDPRLKALVDTVESLKGKISEQEKQEQLDAEIAEFEKELDELENKAKEDNLPFDRTFVTALMAQGHSGTDAVKSFHQVLAGQGINTTQQETNNDNPDDAPTILGGNPTGSGLPDGTVNFGSLSKNDLNNSIEQLLMKQAEANQG